MKMVWKSGSKHRVDPNEAHKAVVKVAKKNGGNVEPQLLVDAARPKNHVLHPEFEWDDTEAARQHRLSQARGILRHLVIEDYDIPSNRPVRAYGTVLLPATPDTKSHTVYRMMDDVMSNPMTREATLEMAKRELRMFKNKYADLKELAKLFEFMEEEILA